MEPLAAGAFSGMAGLPGLAFCLLPPLQSSGLLAAQEEGGSGER